MSESNPLAGLGGGGGFDLNALLEQAQAMQQQVVAAQEELAQAEVEGTVADGLVTVTVNGAGELVGVKIRANSFDPADTEDLEDLIVAAYRDARARSDAMAADAFGPLAGGLDALAGDQSGDQGDDQSGEGGSRGPGGSPLGF